MVVEVSGQPASINTGLETARSWQLAPTFIQSVSFLDRLGGHAVVGPSTAQLER